MSQSKQNQQRKFTHRPQSIVASKPSPLQVSGRRISSSNTTASVISNHNRNQTFSNNSLNTGTANSKVGYAMGIKDGEVAEGGKQGSSGGGELTRRFRDWFQNERIEYASWSARILTSTGHNTNSYRQHFRTDSIPFHNNNIVTVKSIGSISIADNRFHLLPVIIYQSNAQSSTPDDTEEEIFLAFSYLLPHPQFQLYSNTIDYYRMMANGTEEAQDSVKSSSRIIGEGTRIKLASVETEKTNCKMFMKSRLFTRFQILPSPRDN